ncbi:MAG: hypothetical protein AB7O54_00750 [Pseudomonadales bacterium]
MPEFQLFRIKFYKPRQDDWVDGTIEPRAMVEQAIMAKPSSELRSGYVWHIGNTAKVGDEGLYFALGRTTPSVVEMWDEELGRFDDTEFESSPYTHVFVDLTFQVCAIARKTRLSPTIDGIARNLQRLLNSGGTAISRGLFEVSEIKNPDSFIASLRNAHAILKLAVSFERPNPWDVNQDFQKPLEDALEKVNGTKGRAELAGEDLDEESVEEIARSAAATGNNATARIIETPDSKPLTRSMDKDSVSFSEEEVDGQTAWRRILNRIRELYLAVRDTPEGDVG